MPIDLTSNSATAKAIEAMRQRAQNPRPFTNRVGERLLRMTQRRAPRGRSRGMQGLRASLNLNKNVADTVVSIQSDKVYADIQDKGGTIMAGKGRLKSEYLVIPVNARARRIIERLGASESLRNVPGLVLVTSKAGNLVLIEPKRRHGTGALFALKRSVTLPPNPAPDGYTPNIEEPEVKAILAREGERYFLKGA